MQNLKLLLIACLLCLTACSDLAHLSDPDKTLVVELAPNGDTALTEKILRKRFGAYTPSIFSKIDSAIDGDRITFTFHRGAPPREDVDYLVSRRGVLTAKFADGELVYSDQDIEDAGAKFEHNTVYLLISVTDESSQRIGPLTERNIGRALDIELDGNLFLRSTISERLWKRFQLSAQFPLHEIQRIAILLRYGALPVPVRVVSNEI
jgi:preprotein translocase subunit SecD